MKVATSIKNIKTIDELCEVIMRDLNDKVHSYDNKLTGFAIDLQRGEVATTHSAPIGKSTSWSSYARYPAWEGRIWLRFQNHRFDGWAQNLFNGFPVHIGTGGGGNYRSPWTEYYDLYWKCFQDKEFGSITKGHTVRKPELYSWTFHFYELDFPLIARSYDRKALLDTIAGNDTKQAYAYKWMDTPTLFDDRKFISDFREIKLAIGENRRLIKNKFEKDLFFS